jgi:hypothetical protein
LDDDESPEAKQKR